MAHQIAGAEILVESLIRENVEVIFGYPGGATLPLYDSLYGAKLRHLLVRHEQAAVFGADGYARATGKPGVCLVTSGPGATNLLTGLTSSLMDSIPVVAFTGQVPSPMIGKDAFQECDTIGITMPATKKNFMVRSTDEIPGIVHEAFKTAISGRPGPVLVDIPKDILIKKKVPTYHSSAGSIQPEYQREWGEDEIRRAADMIMESRRGVLYVGGGVIHSNAADEVFELAELTHLPVTTTLMALGAFPSRHPLSLGMLGMHGCYGTNIAVCNCDLLVAIGARFDDRVTGRIDGFAAKARKIHFDVDPSQINKNVSVDLAVVGNAKEALQALIAELRRRNHRAAPPERQAWLAQISDWRSENPLGYDKSEGLLKPQHVIESLSSAAPPDTIVSVDVGQHQMWTAQHYAFSMPRTFLSSSGLGAMGYGFPAAIGAQMAWPDRTVIAIVGDGGFQMTLPDLATIGQYQLPVKIAIINNRCLGMVRQWQEIFFEQRYCEVDLSYSPDFVRLAEAYGIRAARVSEAKDMPDAIRSFLSDREPQLLDFMVDPRENVYPIIPPGASLAEMIVGPPKPVLDFEEETVDDLWAY
ncbi:MAG: biosynthetic-type acetolactate synthase large subunit [Acidobacteriota bacterium]